MTLISTCAGDITMQHYPGSLCALCIGTRWSLRASRAQVLLAAGRPLEVRLANEHTFLEMAQDVTPEPACISRKSRSASPAVAAHLIALAFRVKVFT